MKIVRQMCIFRRNAIYSKGRIQRNQVYLIKISPRAGLRYEIEILQGVYQYT